jgi:long-chain acyl-CoA synthetase
MDGKGRWRDNVFVERLWRPVKLLWVLVRRIGAGHLNQSPANTEPHTRSPESFCVTQPEAVAFILPDRQISWREWNDHANRLAGGLQSLGIGQNDRVAVRSGTRFEWFVVNLALGKLGAASVMVSRHAKPLELAHIFADSRATGLICDDPDLDEIATTWHSRQWNGEPGPIVSIANAGNREAYHYERLIHTARARQYVAAASTQSIIYTSGTTGRPKGVFRDPAGLAAHQEAVTRYHQHLSYLAGAGPDAVYLLMHPMHHGAGVAQAQICLRGGGTVVIQPGFDPERTLSLIERHRVTNIMAVPTMLHRIRTLPDSVRGSYDVSSLRILLVGGAAVPHNLKVWVREFFGPDLKIYETYGATEVWLISVMMPEFQFERPGSCGQLLPGVKVKILGKSGETLPAGEIGEICAKTPLMIDRYLDRPPMGPEDMTKDGFYRTGDGGYLDEDGFLYVTDRIKDVIVSGGVNIYPAEIEDVLISHPGVVDAAVIGVPNTEFGEQVMAFCETRQGADPTVEELIAFCRERLTAYKAPKSIRFVADLPRNASGKVMKNALRDQFWAGRERRV